MGNRIFIIRIKDTKNKISFHLSVFFRKFWIEIEVEQNFYYPNHYITLKIKFHFIYPSSGKILQFENFFELK